MLVPVGLSSFSAKSLPLTILAGDIGGTKTNLALYAFAKDSIDLIRKEHFHTKSFAGIIEMVSAFLSGEGAPGVIALGAAGPIKDGMVNMTNLEFHVNSHDISEHFGNIPVFLINDLEAAAFSLACLDEQDVVTIQQGTRDGSGNIAVIAPGTGLGEAGLYCGGKSWSPFATEGGHCDFAARTPLDLELFAFLQPRFGHVSWERLVSGPGIGNIFDFLVEIKGRSVPEEIVQQILAGDKAAVIGEHAAVCPVCKETIDLFIRYLAQESANLALKLKATGGLFITGGILPKIRDQVQPGLFSQWFCSSGRMNALLEGIPIHFVLNEEAPLIGAAYYGAHQKWQERT